ncbi:MULTISPECIES: lactonase family protein [unclassified Undibacterium]|uniref:lactonase family protein n=1 Tax=unclassified Undibacterium TaxID=2630295 RepID=UPI002AC9F153|nr:MULTISPECIES: beta-propeller fold lactonase family protein [unclassified Undibacterium]MEB0140656.1 beta-propeller fold lactonase family protein [Undibacterium sp. CCC2.1]MEB0172420.1 beta-propeller fold lactonase family protein [Undibacterium sp. CCC1.1]MEB0177690.1 beta-propeller fold lactonase family protein [Undibacterium sp. CCC3.4]MEB0215542.1 beta-propeller fold lactonase family protein [Undibacterium sp. 5I2]WPX43750.1 beta-propeller fold lactonase family protein [Undibacterium sp. 
MHSNKPRLQPIILLALLGAVAASASAASVVYVSNADSKDIYVLSLNEKNGDLTLLEKVDTGATVMPLAISPDHRHLYASLRSQPYSVVTYAINAENGKLSRVSVVALADNMANLATDKSGRYLFAASYAGHKISVNRISPDGEVMTPPVSVTNTGKNAHAIATDPSNAYLFASNLGSDVILQYKFDDVSGAITPNTPAAVATKPGAGPRHFVFHPSKRFVYSTNELDGTVNTYAYNAEQGVLTLQSTDSAVPPASTLGVSMSGAGTFVTPTGPNLTAAAAPATADIHLTPDGRFLYASERSSSTLAAYRVDAKSGALTAIGNYATETQPRGFNIDPLGKYLLAVGQKSNGLSSYAINQKTGVLKPLAHVDMGKNPNWVEIIALPSK